ncbi:MAG TPA: hypothetical protein VK666_21965 [Chryseolinea sp.]|nr:hypothetical protein [Chryseolinea sp.]
MKTFIELLKALGAFATGSTFAKGKSVEEIHATTTITFSKGMIRESRIVNRGVLSPITIKSN